MFELWDHGIHESKCIAIRSIDEIKLEYHNMQIGEFRVVRENSDGTAVEIYRVE